MVSPKRTRPDTIVRVISPIGVDRRRMPISMTCPEPSVRTRDRFDVEHRQSAPRLFEFELAQPAGVAVGRRRVRVRERAETIVFGLRIGIRCADRHVSFLPAASPDRHRVHVRRPWQDDGVSENLTIDDTATRWSTSDRGRMPRCWCCCTATGRMSTTCSDSSRTSPRGVAVASVAAPLAPPWPMRGGPGTRSRGSTDAAPRRVTVAAEAFLRWLDAAVEDAPSVALLGFSQGAAVSLQALRLAPPSASARSWRSAATWHPANCRTMRHWPSCAAGLLGARHTRRRHPARAGRSHGAVAARALRPVRPGVHRAHAQHSPKRS